MRIYNILPAGSERIVIYGLYMDHIGRIRSIMLLICVLVGMMLGVDRSSAIAFESVRTEEINQCRSGELATWGDGKDRPAISSSLRFTYNPADAPRWFAKSLVTGMITKSTAAWSQCDVRSLMVDWNSIKDKVRQDDVIKIQWSDKDSLGNFGLANLSKRTLSLGPKAFQLLKTVNPTYDSRETLQMVISHEMGHFFGLMAHSRRCVDVLSYYDNGKGEKCYSRDPAGIGKVIEYRYVLPTACDIERCRIINGKPPLVDGRLAERPRSE